MYGRRRGGGSGNKEAPGLLTGNLFVLEFGGVRQVRGKIRANGLAWSWGLSCSGGRGGRGRWGGGGDDEEEENNAVEKPLSINTQDISMTGYFERSMLRSAMNSIAQGSYVGSFRLLGFSLVDLRKESELTPESETDREILIRDGLVRVDPYMIIEAIGRSYVSSCSLGGSGGEDFLTMNITISCSGGYKVHYGNTQGRDTRVNMLDESARLPLGCTISSGRPKSYDEFGEELFREFLLEEWSPASHKFWPEDFRVAVRTFLLVRQRHGGNAFLNKDILHKIIRIASEAFLPEGVLPSSMSPFKGISYHKMN